MRSMRWEYKVHTKQPGTNMSIAWLEAFCNTLGDNGWELVSVVPGPLDIMMVFKRPKTESVS